MVPRPAAFHQRASGRLFTQLESQLPPSLAVLQDFEVVTDSRYPPSVRAPDLVVAPEALIADNPTRLDASDVLLAVEVLSPGTVRTDRVSKFVEYAAGGVSTYWIVDLRPPVSLSAYILVDGRYEVTAEGTGAVALLTPATLTVDLDALLR